MRVLLIQIRPDETIAQHEVDCFSKTTGLAQHELTPLNVFNRLPHVGDLAGYDALLVGGCGEFLLSNGDIPREIQAIGKLMDAARLKDMPVMSVCFGAQILSTYFGGIIVKDSSRAETGVYELTKNDLATSCPILNDLPKTFLAQFGHQDHITQLPKGAVNLASTQLSEVQVFTFPGERTYGFVFHPELDEQSTAVRIRFYAKQYGMTEAKIASLVSALKPSPYATTAMQRFFSEVAKKNQRLKLASTKSLA